MSLVRGCKADCVSCMLRVPVSVNRLNKLTDVERLVFHRLHQLFDVTDMAVAQNGNEKLFSTTVSPPAH